MGNRRIAAFAFLACVLVSCVNTGGPNLAIIPKPASVDAGHGYYHYKNGRITTVECEQPELEDSLGTEGYIVKIRPFSIRVYASGSAGWFYAEKTIQQLMMLNDGKLPCVTVTDRPRFAYRGFHMDVSRHFFPVEHVLRTLDWMSFYKFNNFHFHLTDNGGWRLEVKSHPELTEQAAFRTEKDWDSWFHWTEPRRFCTADTPGCYGGYYTQDDIRRIVAYADSLHINVIPEIEFPAHSDGVFASHPELKCLPNSVSHDGMGDFCPSSDEVFAFAKDVLDEVMELFPSKIIHIGGDEAQKKDWERCPRCRAFMAADGMTSADELQSYLIRRIERYLADNGREMAGWDEILKNDDLLPSSVVYSYRGEKGGIEAANRGLRAVMTPGEVLYCDWYQAKPAKEPKAMYGYSPIRKMYAFHPVPDTPELAASNETLVQERQVDEAGDFIRPENSCNVYGVQGCLWSEYVPTEEHHDYMMFPRACAIAELAWSVDDSKDWPDFRARVNAHRRLLVGHGVNAFDFHNAPYVETECRDGQTVVTLDAEIDPCEIRYTLDGSKPLPTSLLYEGPFTIDSEVRLCARAFVDGRPASFVEEVTLTPGETRREYYPDSYKQSAMNN